MRTPWSCVPPFMTLTIGEKTGQIPDQVGGVICGGQAFVLNREQTEALLNDGILHEARTPISVTFAD